MAMQTIYSGEQRSLAFKFKGHHLGMRKEKVCQEMSGNWLEQLEGRFSPGKLEEAGEESVQGTSRYWTH